MSILIGLLGFIYIVVCLLLILIILLQRGESGGLGHAFGGGSLGETALGPRGDTTLKTITSVLAGAFVVLTVLLGYMTNPGQSVMTNPGTPPEQPVGIPADLMPEPSAPPADSGEGAGGRPELPPVEAPAQQQ